MASAAIDKRRKISATIRKDGKLIANARVELWPKNGKLETGFADAKGTCVFGSLDSDTYEVKAFATVNGVAYRGSLTRAVTGTHEYVFLIDLKK